MSFIYLFIYLFILRQYLILYLRLTLNSWQSSCFSIPISGITGVGHTPGDIYILRISSVRCGAVKQCHAHNKCCINATVATGYMDTTCSRLNEIHGTQGPLRSLPFFSELTKKCQRRGLFFHVYCKTTKSDILLVNVS